MPESEILSGFAGRSRPEPIGTLEMSGPALRRYTEIALRATTPPPHTRCDPVT
jgi:hypothetical protein